MVCLVLIKLATLVYYLVGWKKKVRLERCMFQPVTEPSYGQLLQCYVPTTGAGMRAFKALLSRLTRPMSSMASLIESKAGYGRGGNYATVALSRTKSCGNYCSVRWKNTRVEGCTFIGRSQGSKMSKLTYWPKKQPVMGWQRPSLQTSHWELISSRRTRRTSGTSRTRGWSREK